MPDGDKIHPKLPRRYEKHYKKICEGQMSNENIAEGIAITVRDQIKQDGDNALWILRQVIPILDSAQSGPLFAASIDWADRAQQIEHIVQHANRMVRCSQRVVGRIVRAAKQMLESLQQGSSFQDVSETLHHRYLGVLYQSEFEGRVPLVGEHYNGADHAFVSSQLKCINPYVDEHLQHMASSLHDRETADRLRIRRRNSPRPNWGIDSAIDDIGV